jgi:hypothetical protein
VGRDLVDPRNRTPRDQARRGRIRLPRLEVAQTQLIDAPGLEHQPARVRRHAQPRLAVVPLLNLEEKILRRGGEFVRAGGAAVCGGQDCECEAAQDSLTMTPSKPAAAAAGSLVSNMVGPYAEIGATRIAR